MLALCLMVVCGLVSGFAGWMAWHLEQRVNAFGNRWTSPLIVIGMSVCLFALCLTIWAFIGDRARGRMRCPKCWYDMSGSQGLQCPECGRAARNEQQLSKSRRPRWAFVLAVLMIVPAVYAMAVGKQVEEDGYLAAVPTWFLIAGWNHLPESWIIGKPGPLDETNLEARLASDQVSRPRMEAFEARLYQPMLSDPNARANHKRIRMLGWITYKRLHWDTFGDGSAWNEAKIDIDALFRRSSEDIYEALINPSVESEERLKEESSEMITLARTLVVQRAMKQGAVDLQTQRENWRVYRITGELIEGSRVNIADPAFLDLLWSDSLPRSNYAHQLLLLANRIDLYPRAIANLADLPPEQMGVYHFERLAHTFLVVQEQDQIALMEQIIGLSRSDSAQQQRDAITAVYFIQRLINDREILDDIDGYPQLIEFARQQLNNETLVSFDNQNIRMENIAIRVVNAAQPGDAEVYERALARLIETGDAPPLERGGAPYQEANRATDQWLVTFGNAQLATSNDPRVRRWYIENIPETLKTPHDETLNQLAAFMLDDPDPEIAELATQKLYARGAVHLIPELMP